MRSVTVTALMAGSLGADLCGRYLLAGLLLVAACAETFLVGRRA